MVTHVNYAKNVLERQAVLELLVLGLFRPFDKIRFSTDRRFQKCTSKRGERYILWAPLLSENEAKGTLTVLSLFLDSPIASTSHCN